MEYGIGVLSESLGLVMEELSIEGVEIFCITVVPTMANYKLPQKYAKKTLSQNNDYHCNPLSQLLLTTKNNFTSIII